ncbi:MAG: glutamate--cysteine ligase [Alphaproteobacteria bacterium]|nr:MAG: glutamate--cysteine ligase [Alphaproteobacteria bacterium]
MSSRIEVAGDDAPIESVDTLVAFMAAGAKPPAHWRIGTEHEKFVYRLRDKRPVGYDEPGGIRDTLTALAERYGWQPVVENGQVIALSQKGASVSLEPGGQLELSGAPLVDIHQTCEEVGDHLAQVKAIGADFQIGFLGAGFIPHAALADMPLMPKARYGIMQRYMPKKGRFGLDMMFRTCTIQVNLDFGSEADMVKKFRVGMALQPVATALFANSPFTEGKPNGYLSYRSHMWTDTDPDRTGVLPFVFDGDMGFARYVDYALDVPMYFVYRGGRYIDVAGQSFRDFMAGRLPGLPGERPTLADWKDHLSTLFPEVRLKTFLEMRGADGGPWNRICALPALWVGLLYDATAQDAAWDLVKGWTVAEHRALRLAVPRLGLKAPTPIGDMRTLAREVLAIADTGLKNRAARDFVGDSEQGFLASLHDIAESGLTPADRLLAAYHGEWGGDIGRIFEGSSF